MTTTHPYDFPVLETPVGTVHRLPTEYFLQQILPPLRADLDAKRVLASIRRFGSKSRRPITKVGRWRGFAEDPVKSTGPETASLTHFADIVKTIAKAGASAGKGVLPSLELLDRNSCWPQADARSQEPDITSLPHAYLVARGTLPHDAMWSDFTVAGWYRKDGELEDQEDNCAKVIDGMTLTLQDLRRRHAFGYTIANVQMEFWFCDKSQIIVSNPVNWITDHLSVVRFFLPLLFADPTQLGWDTTIVPTCDPGGYDIAVEDADHTQTVYRTLELLSSTRTELTSGKGTRIWRAVELRNGASHGDPVVLKDVWRREELGREGDALHAILTCEPSPNVRALLAERTLTVLHHGDVVQHSTEDDHSYVDCTRRHPQNAVRFLQGKPLTDTRYVPASTRIEPHYIPPDGRRILLGRLFHYRVVVAELCTPLSDKPFPVIFKALSDICEVMRIMHRNGWIHRDISYGNILLNDHDHARLIDFEYAKKARDCKIPEFRVGTASFMAVEIDSNRHRFRPRQTILPPWKRRLEQRKKAEEGEDTVLESQPNAGLREFCRMKMSKSSRPPFNYNPLHDLESLWWLISYSVFEWAEKGIAKNSADEAEQARLKDLRAVSWKLFNDFATRQRTLCDADAFAFDIGCLEGDALLAGRALEEWRQQLVQCYIKSEKDSQAVMNTDFSGLHDSLIATIDTILSLLSSARSQAKEPAPQDGARDSRKRRSRESDERGSRTPSKKLRAM